MATPQCKMFPIKRHARRPYMELDVFQTASDSSKSPFDFTGATGVVFSMRAVDGEREGELVVDSQAAQFKDSDPTLGILQYQWADGDTEYSGNYIGEFDVQYPNSEPLTLPLGGNINIKIYEDVNNA